MLLPGSAHPLEKVPDASKTNLRPFQLLGDLSGQLVGSLLSDQVCSGVDYLQARVVDELYEPRGIGVL
jgi:hypothetical protein